MKLNLLVAGIAALSLPFAKADFCFYGYQTSDCSGSPVVSACADSLTVGQCHHDPGPFRYVKATGESNKYNILLYAGNYDCNAAPAYTGALKQTVNCADTRQNYDSFKRYA